MALTVALTVTLFITSTITLPIALVKIFIKILVRIVGVFIQSAFQESIWVLETSSEPFSASFLLSHFFPLSETFSWCPFSYFSILSVSSSLLVTSWLPFSFSFLFFRLSAISVAMLLDWSLDR